METVEDKIRDYLADNLDFIADRLVLIKKEFPLPNFIGSKGYVDLLAKDVFNNFVIIEIKRSRASSRETIQEILKYVGLLKQNFKARDSEIKIIILSTDWSELLVPFSQLLYETTLNVQGYKITVDQSSIPISKEGIDAIDVSGKRSIAKSSFLYLFYEEAKRQKCIENISRKCEAVGFHDFLLVKLFNDRTRNPNLPYHYGLCFAFQAMSVAEYHDFFNRAHYELDMEADEFDELEDYFHYFEQNVIIVVDAYHDSDESEAGYPEKLDAVLGVENWKVEDILRYGIFDIDPRYSKEMLLRELRGLDGASGVKYLNFGESTHTNRLLEVKENCVVPVRDNALWYEHIQNLFDTLSDLKKPFRFVINVYHPESVFDTIWQAMKFEDPNYLPIYLFYVDFIDENKLWIFSGGLAWNGQKVNTQLLHEYFRDNSDALFNKFLDCVYGAHDYELLSKYNLMYENSWAEITNDLLTSVSNVRFENGRLSRFDSGYKTIFDWLDENTELKRVLGQYYAEYTLSF